MLIQAPPGLMQGAFETTQNRAIQYMRKLSISSAGRSRRAVGTGGLGLGRGVQTVFAHIRSTVCEQSFQVVFKRLNTCWRVVFTQYA